MQSKRWLSIHIFYHNNNNPLIVECLKPLVDNLRDQGLISRYFFIKYWMEGPHVRLRLLPAPGINREDLRRLVEPRILAYLRRKPSLLKADPKVLQPFYRGLFEAEYGTAKWEATYGKDGIMPLRTNNTIGYIDYEPEYHRYGGEVGMDLAEWHFEHSSDMSIQLLRDTNSHVRTILLGLCAQVMLHFCYGLLQNDEKVMRFLDSYYQYWYKTFYSEFSRRVAVFEKKPLWTQPDLQRRIARIRTAVLNEATSQDRPVHLMSFERSWSAHIQELRQRIATSAMRQQLVFLSPGAKDERGAAPVADPDLASHILLHSYVHMTSNRLGVPIFDEMYLSYVLRRCLEASLLTEEVTL
jgi:hypothetical protein